MLCLAKKAFALVFDAIVASDYSCVLTSQRQRDSFTSFIDQSVLLRKRVRKMGLISLLFICLPVYYNSM